MGLFSMLKRNSRLALKGNWGGAVLLLLIAGGVSILIGTLRQMALATFVTEPMWNVPAEPREPWTAASLAESFNFSSVEWVIMGVSALVTVLLLAPLGLGMARWFYGVVHGEKNGIGEAFGYFESGVKFGRALWYDLNMYIRSMFWAALFYIVPGSILGVSLYFLSGREELTRAVSAVAGAGIFLSAVMFILATIFFAACMNRYALVPYLLAEDGGVTVRKAIRQSVTYTKGFRFNLVWFSLSFLGWFLLIVVFFPVMFYAVPYYSTATAMYARYIIEKNRCEEPDSTQEFTSGGEDARVPGAALPEIEGDFEPVRDTDSLPSGGEAEEPY